MSISSLAPATRMFGWFASTASAGSFCLFCENGEGGLPTVTRVSGLTAAAGIAVPATRAREAVAESKKKRKERFTIKTPPALRAVVERHGTYSKTPEPG